MWPLSLLIILKVTKAALELELKIHSNLGGFLLCHARNLKKPLTIPFTRSAPILIPMSTIPEKIIPVSVNYQQKMLFRK